MDAEMRQRMRGAQPASGKKGDWTVEVECTVRKRLALKNCTAEEAEKNPWDHCEEEYELHQIDWEFKSIKEAE